MAVVVGGVVVLFRFPNVQSTTESEYTCGSSELVGGARRLQVLVLELVAVAVHEEMITTVLQANKALGCMCI